MVSACDIQEHAQVIGACGKHVGTVDRIEGKLIKLAKDDPTSGGYHHFVPLSWVQEAGLTVRLNKTSDQARKLWGLEPLSVGD